MHIPCLHRGYHAGLLTILHPSPPIFIDFSVFVSLTNISLQALLAPALHALLPSFYHFPQPAYCSSSPFLVPCLQLCSAQIAIA
jgi:hypothetical protein